MKFRLSDRTFTHTGLEGRKV